MGRVVRIYFVYSEDREHPWDETFPGDREYVWDGEVDDGRDEVTVIHNGFRSHAEAIAAARRYIGYDISYCDARHNREKWGVVIR